MSASQNDNKPKAVVIGASSGIGRSVAKIFSEKGYRVAITARRENLLQALRKEMAEDTVSQRMDVREFESSMDQLGRLIEQLGGMDVIVLNAGINQPNENFDWEIERKIAEINAMGFMALANRAVKYFQKQGHGHLVGISSVASQRGSGRASAYSASKAFMVNYLEGLRQKLCDTGITVTDIRPGFVDTAMIAARKGVFWSASPDKAARDIFEAIRKKKKTVYVTGRWFWAAQLYKILPDFVYNWGYRKYR